MKKDFSKRSSKKMLSRHCISLESIAAFWPPLYRRKEIKINVPAPVQPPCIARRVIVQ